MGLKYPFLSYDESTIEFNVKKEMLFQITANYCCFEKGRATMSQFSQNQDENSSH